MACDGENLVFIYTLVLLMSIGYNASGDKMSIVIESYEGNN